MTTKVKVHKKQGKKHAFIIVLFLFHLGLKIGKKANLFLSEMPFVGFQIQVGKQ